MFYWFMLFQFSHTIVWESNFRFRKLSRRILTTGISDLIIPGEINNYDHVRDIISDSWRDLR